MRTIALDIGMRRTGVAFLDARTGVPVPLETIDHKSIGQLVECVLQVASERNADRFLIGNPLLPDGTEGRQSRFVRDVVSVMEHKITIPVLLVDERYSNRPRHKDLDPHAAAAISLLCTKIED